MHLDAIAKGDSPQKKFKDLDDLTAGEYFVKFLVPKVVELLASKLDIKQMNDLCRKQAMLGLATTTKTDTCAQCKKDNTDKNYFKCKNCVKVD